MDNYHFYIPKNVSTRFEIVKGIGIREIIYVAIAIGIGVLIGYIVNLLTHHFVLALSIVVLLGGGTYIFNIRDNNNQSVVSYVKDIVRFSSAQKFYPYRVKEDNYGAF